MQVTDETVELGCKAIADQRGYVWPDEFSDDEKKIGRENMRAALIAALSDKQAGEVSCIACEGRPSAGNNPCAVCGRSALVDVPAVEPVGYTTQWNLDEVRAGRLGTIAPADTMRPENEIPLYTSPPLTREGEDSAEAFARIVAARKAHVDAVNTYNARLALVNGERAKGNWSMKVDDEAKAMWDAQSAFIKAAQEEADAALAATRSGSATTAKGVSE